MSNNLFSSLDLKHLKNETLETSMGSSSNDLSREENLMSNH